MGGNESDAVSAGDSRGFRRCTDLVEGLVNVHGGHVDGAVVWLWVDEWREWVEG